MATDDSPSPSITADADRQAAVAQGDLALVAIMRDYISYGHPGMLDLKKALRLRNPPPLVTIFARDLYAIIMRDVPVPTATVNSELAAGWEKLVSEGKIEAEVDGESTASVPYDTQGCYEALVDLWEYLQLEASTDADTGASTPRARSLKGAWNRNPAETFKAWWHKGAATAFIAGSLFSTATYLLAYHWWQGGLIHKFMLVFSLIGFLVGAGGATFLWLRRARWINPDAFAGKESQPRRRR